MTSDGIITRDWDKVQNLAERIVLASEAGEDPDALLQALLALLSELESSYGRLPSLLATRADYVDDFKLQESLLEEAYESAVAMGDDKNTAYIAATLLELYQENPVSKSRAQFWSGRLWRAMIGYRDEYILSVYRDCTGQLEH